MKSKPMNRMYDDRYAGQFRSKAPQESGLGVMGVNDMVVIVFQEEGHFGEGQQIFYWIEGLNQGLEGFHPHVRISHQLDQWATGGAQEFRVEEPPVHTAHTQEGVLMPDPLMIGMVWMWRTLIIVSKGSCFCNIFKSRNVG